MLRFKSTICVPVMMLILLISMSVQAYADELSSETRIDIFGNVIEWDPNGSGDEDSAGLEDLNDTKDMTAPTYSFEEQTEVLSEMQEYETEAPEETGYLSISIASFPAEWNEGNVKVTVYRESNKYEIWLYRQADWTAREELPIGKYTFRKAETADGSFIFSPSSDNEIWEISGKSTFNLVLFAGDHSDVSVSVPETDESEISDAADETVALDIDSNPEQNTNIDPAMIGSIAAIIGIIIILMCIKKKFKEHKDREYM